jgi:predicted protein tyrosine phosphatase
MAEDGVSERADGASRRRGRRAAAAVLLALAAGGWWWESGGQDRFIPKRFVEVEGGWLYRSGQIDRHLIREVLDAHDIALIVSLRADDPARPDHREEIEAASELGVERVVLSLHGDGTGDPRRYAVALAAMAGARREGRAVLVHCAAGVRRSAAAVALYELLVDGGPTEAAWRELDRFGSPAEESALLPYLNANMRRIAEELVALGAIDRVPDPLPVLKPPPRGLAALWPRWVAAGSR